MVFYLFTYWQKKRRSLVESHFNIEKFKQIKMFNNLFSPKLEKHKQLSPSFKYKPHKTTKFLNETTIHGFSYLDDDSILLLDKLLIFNKILII